MTERKNTITDEETITVCGMQFTRECVCEWVHAIDDNYWICVEESKFVKGGWLATWRVNGEDLADSTGATPDIALKGVLDDMHDVALRLLTTAHGGRCDIDCTLTFHSETSLRAYAAVHPDADMKNGCGTTFRGANIDSIEELFFPVEVRL